MSWNFDLDTLEPGMVNLNQVLLKKLLPAHSLWWTHGSERIQPSLLITEGFPPIESYVGLMDGNWMDWGWGHYSLQSKEVS